MTVERRFRATSADSSSDQKEIVYGCDRFAALIDAKVASNGFSDFTGRILNELRSLPRQRVGRTFLASFCERDDCLTLWKGYGGYSLCFPTGVQAGAFLTAPRGLATGQGFVTDILPAVYDKSEQETMLRSILDPLVEVLEDRSLINGFETGPYVRSLASFVAFTISSLALRVIVCLKNPAFEDEREWRIVVMPSHTAFSSDPTEADQNCQCYIKTKWSKPYVELSAMEPEERIVPGAVFGPPTPPPRLPIHQVRIGPCRLGEEMAQRARQLLDKYRLEEVRVLRSEIPTSLDCH